MDPIGQGNRPLPFPFNCCSCFAPLIRAVIDLAYRFFAWLNQPTSSPRISHHIQDVARLDETTKESDLERDNKYWKQMTEEQSGGIANQVFDLSGIGTSAFMEIEGEEPLLSVKLPRRQNIHFPIELRKFLVPFSEDQLELHFMVYPKPKEEVSVQFEKEEGKELYLGLYQGKGVRSATDGGIAAGELSKVKGDKVAISGKVATGFIGARFHNCTSQSGARAIGVFALFLDSEKEVLLKECNTLQEFADKSKETIGDILKFNGNY